MLRRSHISRKVRNGRKETSTLMEKIINDFFILCVQSALPFIDICMTFTFLATSAPWRD